MPRLEIAGTELTSTDVSRVSLVKRGANRIPFRLTKSEDDDMINLASIGQKLFKKDNAPAAPQLLAVMLAKGVNEKVAVDLIEQAGLQTSSFHKSEDDTAQTFFVPDASLDNAGVLKISEEAALVIGDLKKAFTSYDFTSTSFADVMKSGTFYPSVSNALEMFRDTVCNILDQATSPADTSTAIAKSAEEFKSYLTTLASALPVQAFKAEASLMKADYRTGLVPEGKTLEDNQHGKTDADGGKAANPVVRKEEAKPSEDEIEARVAREVDAKLKELQKAATKPEEKKDEKKEPAKKEDISKRPVFGNATEKPKWGNTSNDIENNAVNGNGTKPYKDGPTSNDIEGTNIESSQRAASGGPAQMTKSDLEAFATTLATTLQKSFTDALDGVKRENALSIDTLKKQVENIATSVEKTEEAVNGTVFSEPRSEGFRTRKSDKQEPVVPALLDTGFSRRAERDAA